jgi:hypothetical protein
LRHKLGLLASILLLALFLVTASSLAWSLRLVDISKLPSVSAAVQSSPPALQLPAPPTEGITTSSDSGIFIAGALVLLIIIIFLARKKRAPMDPYSFWRILGLLLGIVLYFELAQLLPFLLSSGSAGLQAQLELTTVVVALSAILAAAAALAVLTFHEVSMESHKSALLEEASSVKGIRRLLQSMRARVYSMPEPGVYRDSVIACYSAMTRLLGKRGAEDRPSLTPQELEANATSMAGSSKADVHLLTRLFEKARYAAAPVTKHDAEDSMNALERMTGEETARDKLVGTA